jgi:DNA-binding MarR family transcriptional regulator
VRDFFSDKKETESKRSYLARKRAYLSRVLRSLEKEGYVRLTKKGRFVKVSLTDSGKLYSGPPEE